jgi:hypothetical protein
MRLPNDTTDGILGRLELSMTGGAAPRVVCGALWVCAPCLGSVLQYYNIYVPVVYGGGRWCVVAHGGVRTAYVYVYTYIDCMYLPACHYVLLTTNSGH